MYPLDRKLIGLQSRSGCDGEEKNPFIVSAPNQNPVVQPTA